MLNYIYMYLYSSCCIYSKNIFFFKYLFIYNYSNIKGKNNLIKNLIFILEFNIYNDFFFYIINIILSLYNCY
jgi:hypothetical protein